MTCEVHPEGDLPSRPLEGHELAQRVVEYLDALHYILQHDVHGRLRAFGEHAASPFKVPLPTFRPKHVDLEKAGGWSLDVTVWYVDGISEEVFLTNRAGDRVVTYGDLFQAVIDDARDCPSELAKALVRAGRNGSTYAQALCLIGGKKFMHELANGSKAERTLHQRLINIATMSPETAELLASGHKRIKALSGGEEGIPLDMVQGLPPLEARQVMSHMAQPNFNGGETRRGSGADYAEL